MDKQKKCDIRPLRASEAGVYKSIQPAEIIMDWHGLCIPAAVNHIKWNAGGLASIVPATIDLAVSLIDG